MNITDEVVVRDCRYCRHSKPDIHSDTLNCRQKMSVVKDGVITVNRFARDTRKVCQETAQRCPIYQEGL